MSFSERMKLVPEKQIQIDGIDVYLRHRIVNRVANEFDDSQARYVLDIMGYRTMPEKDVYSVSLNRGGKNLDKLTRLLEEMPWNNIYDLLEYGYQYIKTCCEGCTDECYDPDDEDDDICVYRDKMNRYSEHFNAVLEQGKSGYRLVEGQVSPITGESEIKCIEEASSTRFHSVNTHLQKALQFYSDRESPDYENSIKESISAVEAMCCIITGMTGASATLGVALKKLEDNSVVIHGAMRTAFSQLYGYASDADGIRHGGIDFKNAPAEDDKYKLISCSAFENYLV